MRTIPLLTLGKTLASAHLAPWAEKSLTRALCFREILIFFHIVALAVPGENRRERSRENKKRNWKVKQNNEQINEFWGCFLLTERFRFHLFSVLFECGRLNSREMSKLHFHLTYNTKAQISFYLVF